MKKYIYIILILFVSSVVYSQSGWYSITDSIPNLYMISIQFTSENTGYAGGFYQNYYPGAFWKTTNGGINWQKTNLEVTVDDICFLNDLTGYFIGDGVGSPPTYYSYGIIYKTTDGALSWVRKDSILDGNFFKFKFYDVNTGLVVGKRGKAFSTTNGGINWNNISNTYNFWSEPQCIWCLTANTWLVTDGYSIAKTTNLGVNWFKFDSLKAYSLYFLDNTTGYMTADYTAVYKSTNSGTNWTKIFNGWINGFYSRSLIFTNANTGYMCGNSSSVFKTTNGGYNWTEQLINTSSSWFSSSFINDSTGYVSGYNGRIFKTTNGGSVFVSNISFEIPTSFSLGQNYPNPFNPSTMIKFEIPKSSNVKVSVFDITGKEIEVLVNEKLNAGTYQTEWNGMSYSSGVYFYRMVTDNFTETKRMILIK